MEHILFTTRLFIVRDGLNDECWLAITADDSANVSANRRFETSHLADTQCALEAHLAENNPSDVMVE